MKEQIWALILGLTVILGLVLVNPPKVVVPAAGFSPGALVEVQVNGKTVGTFRAIQHNIFQDMGRNITRDMIGNKTGNVSSIEAVDKISLGNCTVPQSVGQTALCGGGAGIEYTTCGLQRTKGLYEIVHTSPGNWTIRNTFTATCDNLPVNATGLYNSTTGNFLFAQANFTTVTLNANDQITITWYLWLTPGG